MPKLGGRCDLPRIISNFCDGNVVAGRKFLFFTQSFGFLSSDVKICFHLF